MGRFLLLVVLIVVAVWVIRRALVRLKQGTQGDVAAQGNTQGDLVKCAHCGTHLPLAEARAVGDRLYCSDEHARLGPGRS